MCGRFFVEIAEEELRKICAAAEARLRKMYPESNEIRISFGDVVPTNVAAVLTQDKGKVEPVAMRWGYPAISEDRANKSGKTYRVMVLCQGQEGTKAPNRFNMTKNLLNLSTTIPQKRAKKRRLQICNLQLLGMISDNEIENKEEVLEIIKRLRIPGYEKARPYFKEAIANGVIKSYRENGYHSIENIDTVLKYIESKKRSQ